MTEFLLILFRWMAAIPGRVERVLHRGWSAERAASPNGSDRFTRLLPGWIVRERDSTASATRRRRGWMTNCREGLDAEGLEAIGISLGLVPAYAAHDLSPYARPDLYKPDRFHHFLSCSEEARRRRAARPGTQGRSTNLSIARNRPLICWSSGFSR